MKRRFCAFVTAVALAGVFFKVDVDTTNGIVQLNGTVDNERMKQRATELARQVDGVRRVVNNLRVQG